MAFLLVQVCFCSPDPCPAETHKVPLSVFVLLRAQHAGVGKVFRWKKRKVVSGRPIAWVWCFCNLQLGESIKDPPYLLPGGLDLQTECLAVSFQREEPEEASQTAAQGGSFL